MDLTTCYSEEVEDSDHADSSGRMAQILSLICNTGPVHMEFHSENKNFRKRILGILRILGKDEN
jgi:hypothetical protein